MYRLFELLDIL